MEVCFQWSASRLGRFATGETAPGIQLIGEWVGTRFGPEDVQKGKISQCWESNPNRLARNPSLYRLTYLESIHSTKGHKFNFVSGVLQVPCFFFMLAYLNCLRTHCQLHKLYILKG
jgi:hypothetical protein